MKKNMKLLALALTVCCILCLSGCGQDKGEVQVIDSLDGDYAVDMKQYAADEGIDYSDVEECSCVWTFTPEGAVTVRMSTCLSASEAGEKLTTRTDTKNVTEYSLSENVTCEIGETAVYHIDEGNNVLLYDHGVVMGSIKSNKTSKGTTTIKLDTPNGSTKTLKGTLAEDGVTFTINNNDNKMSGTYSLKEGNLVAEKGVVLGEIVGREMSGNKITLTVKAPDGENVTYAGPYAAEMKVGGATFDYEYVGDALYLRNSKRTLKLVKQKAE